jgi:hypothetical protein
MAAVLLLSTAPAASPTDDSAPPPWDGTATELPRKLRQRMTGVSWHPGCPVHLDNLRLLRMPYWGFDGEVKRGRMVVRAKQANKTLRVFRRLYAKQFPIRRMRLIDAYDGDDDRSMAANNTSAFNCRRVAGTNRWSEHAYGRAIDINPVQNPYVRGSTVEPEAGRRYLNRSHVRRGMAVRPGPVVRAFTAVDWQWGGDWSSAKDYQHFSRTGR